MKYRKKPVVIDATLLEGTDYSIFNVMKFIGMVNDIDHKNNLEVEAIDSYIDKVKNEGMYIETLEGEMHASIGDYIIKGINGEFYPCKPDIFHKTYEKVGD